MFLRSVRSSPSSLSNKHFRWVSSLKALSKAVMFGSSGFLGVSTPVHTCFGDDNAENTLTGTDLHIDTARGAVSGELEVRTNEAVVSTPESRCARPTLMSSRSSRRPRTPTETLSMRWPATLAVLRLASGPDQTEQWGS